MTLIQKNIWVAAADGDCPRVQASLRAVLQFSLTVLQHLVDVQSLDPNVPDEHTYTPMHAAASYGQLDILTFLISRGGNVNITDSDGDTPLYTVENIETARFLVEHGATIDRRNAEGISPIEHLAEDFPHVSAYLQSLLPSPSPAPGAAPEPTPPSQHAQNAEAEQLTSELMASVADIMQRAEAEGRDPEDELRAAVSRTVAHGVIAGYQLTSAAAPDANASSDTPSKRPRTDPE